MLRHFIQTALKARTRAKQRQRNKSSSGLSRSNRLFFEALEPRRLLAPVIGSTTQSPVAPAATNPVTVSTTVSDTTSSVSSVNLTYGLGGTSPAFTETFGTTPTASGHWPGGSGTGTDNLWTLGTGTNGFQLTAAANYGDTRTNACGLQFNCKSSTGDSIATTNGINAAGMSAEVEFWVQTVSPSSSDTWALAVNSGSGYVTETCQQIGSSGSWLNYGYQLASSQLVSGLKLQFQFSGGGTKSDTGTIYLDQITVNVTTATTVPMSYNGGVYSAVIPAQAAGTVVSYYVTAMDSSGLTTTDPATAPTTAYSYTVQPNSPPTIADTVQFPATVTPTSTVKIESTVTDSVPLTTVNLVYNAGSAAVSVAMTNAGNGVYSAPIPDFAVGTTVRYYVSATNNEGATTTDPGASLASIGYLYSYTVVQASSNIPVVNAIPGGTFTMGDEFNTVDPNHPSDEVPLHRVTLSGFDMGKFDITDEQYCDYLNSALSQGLIQVVSGIVYGAGTTDAYSETQQGQMALYASAGLTVPYGGISWDGSEFSVVAGQQLMPMVGIYWDGAVAYCNWLSTTEGFQPVYSYNTATASWTTNFSVEGYRLPTEAEWEYAADGGNTNPYDEYSWGDDPNTDGTYANTLGSGSPYAQSATLNLPGQTYPWTTPVGFYNGSLQLQSQWGWTGSSATSYQTSNAENGYGLYDMGGNVWNWTNDWYLNTYYTTCYDEGTVLNPTGPATGSYHTLRGGSWAQDVADATISNRDPSNNREPLHDTTYASIGFRIVLTTPSPVQPGAPATPVTTLKSGQGVASDPSGNVYFADAGTNTIYEFTTSGQLSVFQTNVSGLSGLKVDARGNLVACQSSLGQVISISPQGTTTVLASSLDDEITINAPDDLWIDPQGGIYVTDPGSSSSQSPDVFYVSPDRSTATVAISGLSDPTGITGTPDGTTLYVSDAAAGVTYKYSISSGTATDQTVFASVAATAMDVDTQGNVYMATVGGVLVYSSSGTLLMTVPVDPAGATQPSLPAQPVGLSFGGTEKRTLYITTASGFYSLPLATQGVTLNGPPTIAGTTRSIINPLATDTDWVTSNVTDDGYVSSVDLSYTIGGTGLPVSEFSETFGSTPTAGHSSWNGTADNSWTVTEPSGLHDVILSTNASYLPNIGSTTYCGLAVTGADTTPTDTMVTTVNGVDTAGASATVQFYLQCVNASSSQSWDFQVNGGSGWVTVIGETVDKHNWQVYNLTLSGSELSSNMLMRFQFTGNGSGDTVYIDNITVATTFGTTTVVPMYDDGQHHDGAAGDSVYGAEIPAFPTGTIVVYHVIATDNTGQVSVDPAGAPYYYAYKVGQASTTVSFNEVMANATTFVPTSDYPTANLGLVTSSIVGTNNATGVDQGYILVSPMAGGNTYLINDQGQVINTWISSYTSTGRSVFLEPDGDLIRSNSLGGAAPINTNGCGGIIQEFDWQGNLVGQFEYAGYDTEGGVSGLAYEQEHNIYVMPNGDILLEVAQEYTVAQAEAAGFTGNLAPQSGPEGDYLWMEGLVEVKPDWAQNTYTTVWQWSFWNHLVQDVDPQGQTFYTDSAGQTVYVSDYQPTINDPYLLNANYNGANTPVLGRLFDHINGIDYNAQYDEIVISSRVQNEIYIIDHSTAYLPNGSDLAAGETGGNQGHGGDFLYRWGDPSNYGAPGAETLFMQHNVQWIAPGLPGAGDLIVMNNGDDRPGTPYTSIDEWTPPVTATGGYTLGANGAYGPTSETWTWTDPQATFYNGDGGGVQRLPNGDTEVCFGWYGLVFEVTPAGQIDWQFQNGDAGTKGPGQITDTILYQGDSLPPDPNEPGGYDTTVYNAPWYSYSYLSSTITNNQVLPANEGTIENYRDWFELYNSSSSAVSLGGMYLSTSPADPTMYQIPSNISIPGNGYTVFYADDDTDDAITTTIAAASNGVALPAGTITVGSTNNFPSSGTLLVTTSAGTETVTYTGLTSTTFTGCSGGTGTMSTGGTVSTFYVAAGRHTNFTLSASGGSIYLYNVDGMTLASSVTYPAMAPTVSYGQTPDGSGNWTMLATPSPGWSNVPAAPSSITLSSTTVADNQSAGAVVGTISASDEDPFDTFTYSLVSGTGSSGNAAFTISGNTLQTAVLLNAEAQSSYSIRIRATDASGLYTDQVFTISVTHTNVPPVISNTGLASPPSPNQAVTIQSTVTDEQGLTSVNLTYYNETQFPTSTPFAETFGTTATASGSWEGNTTTGTADNTWTVTSGAPLKLATGANYLANGGSGSNCGLQFNCAKNQTLYSITSSAINCTGTAATVYYWTKMVNTLTGDSCTLWLGTGSSFAQGSSTSVTTNSNGFTEYAYNLSSSQLVSGMELQFQFQGSGNTNDGFIDLDQISVVLTGYPTPVTVAMTGNNGVYSAQIPGQANGTQMSYYITATDSVGLTITDPAAAPAALYSYTVQASPITWSFNSSTPPTITNNLQALSPVSGITFNAGAGALELQGNAVDLYGGVVSESSNTQTITLPLTLVGGSQTIDTASGGVTIAGSIGQSGGSFGITKTGSGTLVLSGANTYSGVTTVNAGTLIVANANALPDGTSLVVGAGEGSGFEMSQAAASASVKGLIASASATAAAPPAMGGQAMPVSAATTASASQVASLGVVASPEISPILTRLFGGAAVPTAWAGETPAPQGICGQVFGDQPAVATRPDDEVTAAPTRKAIMSLIQGNALPTGKEEKAAASWYLAGFGSAAQWERNWESIQRAVDVVMAMLRRT